MTPAPHVLHGPALPETPLVLDSPHSGTFVPDDMRAAVDAAALHSACDAFVDALWQPAVRRGVALIAAQASRAYVDANRHADDVDLALVDGGAWSGDPAQAATRDAWASGLDAFGKTLAWRSLDDGRPIYDRRLSVAELRARIERWHRPYQRALAERIAATQARFGACWHLDCHSMNAVGSVATQGGVGVARADVVLGDRDGTTCDPALTDFVAGVLRGFGYDVRLNDPFRGAELVRAWSDPAAGRHSLQIEVNKRLYLDEASGERHAGFATLQRDLLRLVDALLDDPASPLHGWRRDG